jgi:large subunit ribosomal protein L13
MKTPNLTAETASRKWYVVDAEGVSLGRMASRIAMVLRGKNKGQFTPYVDGGDFVVVVNADKVLMTGNKLADKIYYFHSGFPGGIRGVTAGKVLEKHPERLIIDAVKGMLPKGKLFRRQILKLKVYAGPEHPHKAQKPEPIKLTK